MGRRVFKKYVSSCMDCPGHGNVWIRRDDQDGTRKSFCTEYDREITNEHLDVNTRMFNFPKFCKLKEER